MDRGDDFVLRVVFFGLTLLSASLLTSACTACSTPWLAAGTAVLAIGGPLVTTLDAWMARDVRATRRPTTTWFPVIAPARDGALAGFGGTF